MRRFFSLKNLHSIIHAHIKTNMFAIQASSNAVSTARPTFTKSVRTAKASVSNALPFAPLRYGVDFDI